MDRSEENYVSIASQLKNLTEGNVTGTEIVEAVALVFQNRLSPVQTASLLSLLNDTGLDQDPSIIAGCATQMRNAGLQVDCERVLGILALRRADKLEGSYLGGLCTIEGTGGDGHSTFNVSTAASIVASAVVFVAKHGAGASSSKSGAADVLRALKNPPLNLEAVTPVSVAEYFRHGSFAFLFAPVFHPGLKHVASIRKQLSFKTIFNILGPLAHPLNKIMEARVIGVVQRRLGPIYAEALRISGVKNALVVCGSEELDEISCAGPTFCWRLKEHSSDNSVRIQTFQLEPADFGIPNHSLREVPLGKSPKENAEVLSQLLSNKLHKDNPTLNFVLMNAAALLGISGICDSEAEEVIKESGPGDERWKEGMRRARRALEDGKVFKSLEQYVSSTRGESL